MVWYPSLDDVINIHVVAMVELGQAPQLVPASTKLESALLRPRHHGYSSGANLVEQAAYLLEGLAQAHGFFNANKRTTLALADTFLAVNGYITTADRALENMLVGLVAANEKQQDVEAMTSELVAGIRVRITPVASTRD